MKIRLYFLQIRNYALIFVSMSVHIFGNKSDKILTSTGVPLRYWSLRKAARWPAASVVELAAPLAMLAVSRYQTSTSSNQTRSRR